MTAAAIHRPGCRTGIALISSGADGLVAGSGRRMLVTDR